MRRGAAVLMHLGSAAIVLGLGKAHARWIGSYDYTGSVRFSWSMAYIAILGIVAFGVGLPHLERAGARLAASVRATFAAAVGISLLQLLTGSALLPRFVVLLAPALLVPWYWGCAALATGGRVRDAERARVLAVLSPEEAHLLGDDLARRAERAALLVGTLEVHQALATTAGEETLVQAARRQRASVLVLNGAAQLDDSILSQAAELHAAGVRVRTLSLFYEEWLAKLPLPELGRASLMFDIGDLHSLGYQRLKRLIDVAGGAIGAVVLAAVIPLVAVGNLVANRGRLFYSQPRVGRNGVVFSMHKFRTMRPGPPVGEWTEEGDRRVTPFGRLLRTTHLDELPQVWNILRGDLATVGPRPEQPHYVEQLSAKIPFYDFRHLVRPGLTGWAQVNYSYGANDLDALEKLQYEFYYLRRQSLALDLKIIFRTIGAVLMAGGR